MKTFAKHRVLSGLLISGLLASVGCAHSGPPPRELIEARAAFARASAGPAAQHSPARLRLAKQALDEAEMTYGGAPPDEVAAKAYIATRRVQSAEADAETVVASQRREKALRELATMSGVHADRARAEIAAAEQRANSEGQRASAAEQLARDEQGRNAQANASLESEREARAQAEARAREALAELERQANVKRETRGLVITLSGQVLFVTDEATLLPAARTSLDSVAAALAGVTAETGKVIIEGHTDSTGPRDYNVTLARRRAEAVQDYLVSRGAPRDLFRVEGVGPDRPVASNRSTEGRANNRRVEIVIPAGAKLAAERPVGERSSPTVSQRAASGASAAPPASSSAGGTSAALPGSVGSSARPAATATTTTTTTTRSPAPSTGTATTGAGTRAPVGPRPSSTSFPSTIEPPPGTVRPPSPASTPPPAPGTSTSVPAPGLTPPPSPGSSVPPAVPAAPNNAPSPGTSTTPPSTPR
jgi:outer membrane protein OmpA-like peptidoglycan-associated protein